MFGPLSVEKRGDQRRSKVQGLCAPSIDRNRRNPRLRRFLASITPEPETQRHGFDWSAGNRRLGTVDMSAFRTKPSKVTFYAVPTTDREKWRLLVHVPGSPLKYTGNFDSKAEAEAWASGPEGEAWVRTNCND